MQSIDQDFLRVDAICRINKVTYIIKNYLILYIQIVSMNAKLRHPTEWLSNVNTHMSHTIPYGYHCFRVSLKDIYFRNN